MKGIIFIRFAYSVSEPTAAPYEDLVALREQRTAEESFSARQSSGRTNRQNAEQKTPRHVFGSTI